MRKPTIRIVSRHKRLDSVVRSIENEAGRRGIKTSSRNYDLVVSVGGDGTMIRAAVEGKPVMTVKGGSRNHLIDIPQERVGEAFDMLLSGRFREERYGMLEARTGGRRVLAFNDVGIMTSVPLPIGMKISYLDTTLEADADGILVSTPQGSSGWSFSSNGCLLTTKSRAFLLSLLNPVMMPLRSVVVPEVPVRIMVDTKGRDDGARLVADGEVMAELHDGDEVKVSRSSREAVIYRFFEYGLRNAVLGRK
ncbi:MAG: NAD(+)/NADH kinase [Candidatus Micrarchaeota archaeon]|nr:NAD(+)/NADH kinase [Candidatus Micrarchaeota archaeon]